MQGGNGLLQRSHSFFCAGSSRRLRLHTRRAAASSSKSSSSPTSSHEPSSSTSSSSSNNNGACSNANAGWLLHAFHEGSLHPPAALASGLIGFATIAAAIQPSADEARAAELLPLQSSAVEGSSLLLALDQAVHRAVVSSIPPDARHFWAGQVASDSFIILGIAGWILLSVVCLWRSPRQAAAPLAVSWAFYCTTAGAIGHDDPPLVFALKQLFGRARPSEHHHTLSFPSGHTSAAVFTVGALLTVLLPLALQLLSQHQQQQEAEGNAVAGGSSSSSSSGASPSSASSSIGCVKTWDSPGLIYGVWAAAGLTTGAGRVLADAHWVSDTLAACCLSLTLVTVLGRCVRPLMASGR